MTLVELGELLREERIRSGRSVEEMATALRITSRVVRAMEEGDRESMPHPVYAASFLKSYAALLRIDPEVVLPALEAFNDPHASARPVTLMPPRNSVERRGGGGGGGIILPAVLVVAALAFGIFWFQEPLMEMVNRVMAMVEAESVPTRVEPVLDTPPAAPEASSTAPAGTSSVKPDASESSSMSATAASVAGLQAAAPGPGPGQPAAGGEPGAASLNADGLPGNLDPATINAMPRRAGDSDSPDSVVASPGVPTVTARDTTLTLHQDGENQTDLSRAGQDKHQIVLTALEECWVHSSADGTITRQFSLKKGETFALSFENKLVVKLGNAGGVRIKYDGEEMPPAGKSGQVRTLNFPPVLTTTPAPAAPAAPAPAAR